ncbi:hypothetical protein MPSEU_000819800 [Mayamaea pseudoterrestris]|nr:hypothetical protein MPSEU_000819800 [Mayamaea pseudoterrestris]
MMTRICSCLLLCLAAVWHVSSGFQGLKRSPMFRAGLLQHSPSSLVRPTDHSASRSPSIFHLQPLAASSSHSSVSADLSDTFGKFDFDAVVKYAMAIGIEVSLFALIFYGLDKAVAHYAIKVPTAANFVLFYLLALKSRLLNPLANNRPSTKSLETKNQPERKMPSFTPPGFIFPIVWLLIIGPIRAAASCMLYNKLGVYASAPLLALMLHLSIGDVWNTVNNVERRFGASVTGVLLVWLSKAYAAKQYYQVVPLAGKLLGGTLVWLTVAAALVGQTWRLNPDEKTGKLSPLYPATGEPKTRFAWLAGGSKN